MTRICPQPYRWSQIHQQLIRFAETHSCIPPMPPIPLILSGWWATNDIEKKQRWDDTVVWAEKNGCSDLISGIPDVDFYVVENPTNYMIGPDGSPLMYPSVYFLKKKQDFHAKNALTTEHIAQLMDILLSRWLEIVGSEIGSMTRPLALAGAKSRRLLVHADATCTPPWGSWSHLDRGESTRRTFTRFRAAINKAIAPHEVDHIDFTSDMSGPPES